jgi:hypothetical protein
MTMLEVSAYYHKNPEDEPGNARRKALAEQERAERIKIVCAAFGVSPNDLDLTIRGGVYDRSYPDTPEELGWQITYNSYPAPTPAAKPIAAVAAEPVAA